MQRILDPSFYAGFNLDANAGDVVTAALEKMVDYGARFIVGPGSSRQEPGFRSFSSAEEAVNTLIQARMPAFSLAVLNAFEPVEVFDDEDEE